MKNFEEYFHTILTKWYDKNNKNLVDHIFDRHSVPNMVSMNKCYYIDVRNLLEPSLRNTVAAFW